MAQVVFTLGDDVSTDAIYPGRFMATVLPAETPQFAFADFEINARLKGGQVPPGSVIVAGANFGCGSSREHAPWALLDAGFEAVVAASFADIFRSNANRNGLLTVAVGAQIADVQHVVRTSPQAELDIDLDGQVIYWAPGHAAQFAIDAFTKRALLHGLDELGMLLADVPAIEQWERRTGRVAGSPFAAGEPTGALV